MKKLFFATIAATMLFGCSDEVVTLSESLQADTRLEGIVFPNSPAFKSASSRSESTFETDWENFQTVDVVGLDLPLSTPWASLNVGTGNPNRKDVKKEDGWVMVCHTLSAGIHDLPKYIVFYNQLKGILKLFYYHENPSPGHNNDFWHVTFDCPQQAITNVNYPVTPDISYKHTATNYAYTSSIDNYDKGIIQAGWNMLEMPLSYDPDISKNYSMNVSVLSNTKMDVSLQSKFSGKANGTIVTDNSSNPFSSVKDALFKFTGDGANNVVTAFNHKAGIGTDLLKGVISGVATGGMSVPINMIFDTFFGMFSTSQPTVQHVNLTFDGEGSISGTITLPQDAGVLRTNIPLGENTTGVKLGAWNLSEPPTVYMHPIGVIESVVPGNTYDENTFRFRNSGNYKAPIVFNPQLREHIKSYKIKCTPIYRTNSENEPYYPGNPDDVGSLGFTRNPNVHPTTYPCEFSYSKYPSSSYSNYYANYAIGSVTCWHLWYKYGKPEVGHFGYDSDYYKYVYAPGCNEENYIRGGFRMDTRRTYLKFSVYMEVEIEGKTFNTVETRTYKPRYEWDPDLMRKYGNLNVDDIFYYAERDELLRVIDRRILEEGSFVR